MSLMTYNDAASLGEPFRPCFCGGSSSPASSPRYEVWASATRSRYSRRVGTHLSYDSAVESAALIRGTGFRAWVLVV